MRVAIIVQDIVNNIIVAENVAAAQGLFKEAKALAGCCKTRWLLGSGHDSLMLDHWGIDLDAGRG